MEELETSSENIFVKVRNLDIEKIVYKNRVPAALFLFGAIMLGLGVFYAQFGDSLKSSDVEILEAGSETERASLKIVAEVSGAVEKPGVYEFEKGSRIEDALIEAGGVSADADREWMEKFLNRAAKISDGQKLYIPRTGESFDSAQDKQSGGGSASSDEPYKSGSSVLGNQGSTIVNINTASQKELESLWGIGPVYAQNIIEQRPYSAVEELVERKIIKQNVYDRNKDKLSVY